MADDKTQDTPNNAAANEDNQQQSREIQVVAQYIRDMSFECPNIEMLLSGQDDKPNLNVKINVNAKKLGTDIYESAIEFKASATNADQMIYQLELVYSGIFKAANLPEEKLEVFLLINCPTLLFPFMRRIVADLTRENGFPPLFLNPIDFVSLYRQRKQQQQTAEPQTTN